MHHLIHDKSLLKVIYNHYPKNIDPRYDEYEETAEAMRTNTYVKEYVPSHLPKFLEFQKILGDSFEIPLVDFSGGSNWFYYNFVALGGIPPNAKVKNFTRYAIRLGILEKLYSIYLLDSPDRTTLHRIRSLEDKTFLQKLESTLQKWYPDYRPFPMYLFHTRVPHVLSLKRENDEASYYECLISDFFDF